MYSGVYSKILKNYQINLGAPLQIKNNFNKKPLTVMKDNENENEGADEDIEPVNNSGKAQEEADLILREARLEAGRILEDAENEAAALKAKQQEEAWKAGYEEGLSQGRNEYEAMISEAGEIKEKALAEYNETVSSIEEKTVEVIIEVARKVIGKEITQNAEDIIYMARQAFEKSENHENVVLRVSTDDFEYISEQKEKLLYMVDGVGDFEIKKDLSLKKGACILDTAFGSVDSSIQTKMKKIEEAFRNAVGK